MSPGSSLLSERKLRTLPKYLLLPSMSGIAVIFVITGALTFQKFRTDLVSNQLANQKKMTRIIHQSLNLYFDKLKFITEDTVYNSAFDPEKNLLEDAIRFSSVLFPTPSLTSIGLGIDSILEGPRKAIAAPDRPKKLANWQIFK